jgi:hypothetical protein
MSGNQNLTSATEFTEAIAQHSRKGYIENTGVPNKTKESIVIARSLATKQFPLFTEEIASLRSK